MDAQPMKSQYAELLNRLSDMQRAPYYRTACHTLVQAECAIVNLESKNANLVAELVALKHDNERLMQIASSEATAHDNVVAELAALRKQNSELALQVLADQGQAMGDYGAPASSLVMLITGMKLGPMKAMVEEHFGSSLVWLGGSAYPSNNVEVHITVAPAVEPAEVKK